MMKNEKGITLTSLVIMIIVLIIIASIATYSGIGTIRYVKFNKARAEMQSLSAQVNKWKDEYKNGNASVLNYGESLNDISQEAKDAVSITFSSAEITDETIKDGYRFFSENYLKDTLGLDSSYDYIININNRDVLLVGGLMYNNKRYYTLEDFGIINVEEHEADNLSFTLTKGNNTEIVISNVKINFSEQNVNPTDISKFIVEYKKTDEDTWKDVTKDLIKFEDGEGNNITTKFKFEVNEYGKYIVKIKTIDKKYERESEEFYLEARPGIKVGDYITYISPTASVTVSTAETGYSSEKTLIAQNIFRVMDIDKDGNITIMGAMISSDRQTINFQGALGYNNAVYTLNKKCSDLYKDTSKGITARSIKVEDITDKFNQTGKDKLSTDITNQMSSLFPSTNVTKDTINNTVTYSNENTNYPDIFQYEAGGLIDNTATLGVIGQSESYSNYGGLTNLVSKKATTSLTVPYTYYSILHSSEDFDDTKGNASAYQNMFAVTGTWYWLASRCIYCNSDTAYFYLRTEGGSLLNACNQYNSYGGTSNAEYRVCPVVNIPASVKITISTDTSNYHQSNPHVVQ